MVGILGTGIGLEELKILGFLLLFSFIVVEILANPNAGFILLMDKKVFGFPVCENEVGICLAPSMDELSKSAKAFSYLADPSKLGTKSEIWKGPCTDIMCFLNTAANGVDYIFVALDNIFNCVMPGGVVGGIAQWTGVACSPDVANQSSGGFPVVAIKFLLAVIGFLTNGIWILLKASICILGLWLPIEKINGWYHFWFNTFPMR